MKAIFGTNIQSEANGDGGHFVIHVDFEGGTVFVNHLNDGVHRVQYNRCLRYRHCPDEVAQWASEALDEVILLTFEDVED